MNKVRILLLDGCKMCHTLCTGLDAEGLFYVPLNADNNSKLADETEVLLSTINYPIAIVEGPDNTTYVHRVDNAADAKTTALNPTTTKIGCVSVEHMLEILKTLLKQ